METDNSSSPPNSPDSIDLENPPVNTDNIVIKKDNIDRTVSYTHLTLPTNREV